MITFHTIDGDVTIPEPPGFWERIRNPRIEGHIFYKGFRANFRHGSDPDEETKLFGCVDNIYNAGLILQGDNMEEYTDDFHEAVDDFLMEVDNGGYGGYPIEYYTNDTNLLDYYNKYHRKNVVPISNYRYEEDEPLRLAA
jgi:hypothetical protein